MAAWFRLTVSGVVETAVMTGAAGDWTVQLSVTAEPLVSLASALLLPSVPATVASIVVAPSGAVEATVTVRLKTMLLPPARVVGLPPPLVTE